MQVVCKEDQNETNVMEIRWKLTCHYDISGGKSELKWKLTCHYDTPKSSIWNRKEEKMLDEIRENEAIYKDALLTIAGLEGPLTGEDADCFRTWAREALDK